MDRLDRLIIRATPKQTLTDRLSEDNSYLGKSMEELLDYMGTDYRAPHMHTPEWDKFIYALICSERETPPVDHSELYQHYQQKSKDNTEDPLKEDETEYYLSAYRQLYRRDTHVKDQTEDQNADRDPSDTCKGYEYGG